MPRTSFWQSRLIDGIAAASEATFPENDFGAPDWKSTEMARRTLDYLAELPPAQRRLVSVLFTFVELGAVLLVWGFRRFSRIPPGRRTEVIRRWRRSRWFAFRVLGDALKATTTMIYMSHPSVITYIGEYRRCSRPEDALRIVVREPPIEQELAS